MKVKAIVMVHDSRTKTGYNTRSKEFEVDKGRLYNEELVKWVVNHKNRVSNQFYGDKI